MPANHETLLRQWHMLRCIPRYPAKVTASDLKQKLDAADFSVTKRTVERDLLDLSGVFPLVLDNRSKPYGWSWQQDAPSFDLPSLGNNEALMLILVEQHMKGFLPASTIDVLTPYFKAANKHLSSLPKTRHLRAWANKVRSVPPTQPLISPKIDPEIQRAISEALLQERQLSIAYQSRGKPEVHYRIHPLAMVQRGPVTYLSVRISDYPNVRTLALHRIHSAEILDAQVSYPAKFNIDQEIESGHFGFGRGEQLTLQALFRNGYGDHLHETPLSNDQTIKVRTDGALLVTATVADTLQLEWWLLGLGDGVEVLSPKKLRTRIADILRRSVAQYGSSDLLPPSRKIRK